MIWNPWKRIRQLEQELRDIYRIRDILESKLLNAHFRDPKTGRLGKKGVRP